MKSHLEERNLTENQTATPPQTAITIHQQNGRLDIPKTLFSKSLVLLFSFIFYRKFKLVFHLCRKLGARSYLTMVLRLYSVKVFNYISLLFSYLQIRAIKETNYCCVCVFAKTSVKCFISISVHAHLLRMGELIFLVAIALGRQ